jgi:thioester reductase-like protein
VTETGGEDLWDVLWWRSQRDPNAVAVHELADGEEISASLGYGELARRAEVFGASLAARVAPASRVVLLVRPGVEWFVAFYGCLRAGMTAVPVIVPDVDRLEAFAPRLDAIGKDCGAGAVVVAAELLGHRDRLTSAAPLLSSLPWLATDAATDVDRPASPRAARRSALAYILYTSGSTGTPRGVPVTHANALANLRGWSASYPPPKAVVSWAPLSHAMGIMAGALNPVSQGYPVFLLPTARVLERPVRWLRAISRARASATTGANFAYEMCTRSVTDEDLALLDLTCLEWAFSGSEPVRLDTMDRFAARFAPCGFRASAFRTGYGLSEATTTVTASVGPPRTRPVDIVGLETGAVVEAEPDARHARVLVSNGMPLPNLRLEIVDPDTRQPSPAGRVGEIWVKGPSITAGYLDKPDLTAQSFGAVLRSDGAGSFLRTGDLGFMHEGELFITGRAKDLIVIRGKNHYAPDIERTVEAAHPGIRPLGVAAFGAELDGEERLALVAEIAPSSADALADILSAVRTAVAHHHGVQVHGIGLVSQGGIPRAPNGKVLRFACRAEFAADRLPMLARSVLGAATSDAPVTAGPVVVGGSAEDRLTTITEWLRKTAVSLLGATRGFDDDQRLDAFGLDSLNAIQLQVLIDTTFDVMTPLSRLLDGVSVRTLAGTINDLIARPRRVSSVERPASLDADLVLDEEIRLRGDPPGDAPPRRVLVTGATGFLGGELVEQLLRESDADVVCLVRATSQAEARRKLRAALAGRERAMRELGTRLRAVRGDLSERRFGLDEAAFAALAEEVDAVFHVGAWVNFSYPYGRLRQTNVEGTREVLRFVSHRRPIRFHHISTIGVLAGRAADEALEVPLTGDLPALGTGYQQSKWVSERLVSAAAARGIPAAIYRVGLLSQNGRPGDEARESDFLPNFLKGCIELGAVPRVKADTVVVPVDYACRAILRLARSLPSPGSVFHVIHPAPITSERLSDTLRASGHPVVLLEPSEWLARVSSLSGGALRASALYPFLEMLSDIDSLPKPSTTRSQRLLAGLDCPPMDDLARTYSR